MICEFIDYLATPGEKYLGIVTVKLYGKIQVLYKWMERKDGKGCFANAPTFKIGEEYESAVLVDSRIDEKEIMDTIRNGVMTKINSNIKPVQGCNGSQVQMQQSTFVDQSSYAPKQEDELPF
jgi:hypothetical protein